MAATKKKIVKNSRQRASQDARQRSGKVESASQSSKVNSTEVRLTTEQLKSLCDQAERLRFSHGPNAQFWDDCDPEGPHLVSAWMIHRPCIAQWSEEFVRANGWDFSHNDGVNVRAMLEARLRDGSTVALKCDFDEQAFLAHL